MTAPPEDAREDTATDATGKPPADAVAILPARGGSKRIPFKNGRDFCGRPMMAWPIRAAQDSGLFSRIVVSTDDAALARIAADHGAEVPFRRAADLADDHTGTTEVMRDAITRLDLAPQTIVCCLYPTSVFVTPRDFRDAHDRILRGTADWVFTVGAFRSPIDRAYRMRGGRLVPDAVENMPRRSQDLEPAYFDAGQFYFARAATWTTPGAHVWDGAAPVILPAGRCVDIDTEEDWALAETLFRQDHPDRPGT